MQARPSALPGRSFFNRDAHFSKARFPTGERRGRNRESQMQFAVSIVRRRNIARSAFLEEEQYLPRTGPHRAASFAEVTDHGEVEQLLVETHRAAQVADVKRSLENAFHCWIHLCSVGACTPTFASLWLPATTAPDAALLPGASPRREVGLAVGGLAEAEGPVNADFDAVHLPIALGRRKLEYVLVPDEFRDLFVSAIEIFGGLRRVDASSSGFGEIAKRRLRLGENLFYLRAIFALLPRRLHVLRLRLQLLGGGNSQDAYIVGVQFSLHGAGIRRRRSIDARSNEDDGLFSAQPLERIQHREQARRQIQIGVAGGKIQTPQRKARRILIRGEVEHQAGRAVITDNRDTVGRGQTGEQPVGGADQVVAKEINRRAAFHHQYDLGRLVDRQEGGKRLRDSVVEQFEIVAIESLDQVLMRAGDDDADIHAVNVHADGRGLIGGGLLSPDRRGANAKEKRGEACEPAQTGSM